MTRLEELTLKLADDALTGAELRELEALLATEPGAAATHIRLLELEAALRSQRETLDLAEPTLTRLRLELGGSIERRVMQRLETEPPPVWAPSSRRREEADLGWFSRLESASSSRRLHLLWNRPMVLALAASVALLLGLGVWYFGPTMGQPMLAEVQGLDASLHRGTESIPAVKGMSLQPADVLRVGSNASVTITFGAEQTRVKVYAGTEMQLASLARGKRFVVQAGRIEAVVARQRPFHPMILVTPPAEARVLGTKFTLATTTIETCLEVIEGQVRLTRTSDGAAAKVSAGQSAVGTAEYPPTAQPRTGQLLREYWTNLPGDYYVTYLTSHRDFPDHPSGRDYLDKFESPSHWGTNYGARLCGFLHPPKTGDYTFWVATGDGAAFFLSPDDHPENKQQLAYAKPSAPREWTSRPGQQSAAVPLVAGRKYYIEALQKQGMEKEDHLAVAWAGPGREREVIPGKFLSPLEPKSKGGK